MLVFFSIFSHINLYDSYCPNGIVQMKYTWNRELIEYKHEIRQIDIYI